MFETKYKEACENMKLSDSFKTGLVNMMKKESKKAVPKKRLILATVTAVILVSTSVVFAANYATDGQLFKTVLSGFGYDPQTTKSSMTVAAETTVTPTITPAAAATVTPTSIPAATTTAAATPTSTPTAVPTVTPTVTPKATAAPTPKATTAVVVPSGRVAPAVSAAAGANSVTVTWNKISSPDLVGYKVVASKSCSTPKYSENGYYAWITDANTTSCTINNGASYNGGDVGKFSGGTSYYFSVTAIYGDEWQKIAGNAIQVTMPGAAAPTANPASRVAPVVKAAAGANSVTVTWNKISSPDLVGYKVVASVSCSTPKYSENGYYVWITDANTTSCTINNGASYNGGDVGTFSGGTPYYFSVTAIYGDEWQKIAGNAIQVTMPGAAVVTPAPVLDPEGTYPAVTLNAPGISGTVANLSWSKTADTTGFQFYKVVVSTTNSAPAYPGDGYVFYTQNPDELSYSHDLGGPGTYYISITAVYCVNDVSHYSAGNVQTVVIP